MLALYRMTDAKVMLRLEPSRKGTLGEFGPAPGLLGILLAPVGVVVHCIRGVSSRFFEIREGPCDVPDVPAYLVKVPDDRADGVLVLGFVETFKKLASGILTSANCDWCFHSSISFG